MTDEVQRQPALFSALRPHIDEDRRSGRFLLLGSASPELMRAANESLAGRIIYSELSPFSLPEAMATGADLTIHLPRGGHPQALAREDRLRPFWTSAYLATFVTRDLAELGIRTNTPELERLLVMLAHHHGGLFNASELASSLRITAPTVQRYVDSLGAAFLIRVLRPIHANPGKGLVKSPRVYWRDSGLRHGPLGIRTYNDLLHPAVGSTWEGYAVEELCRAAGSLASPGFDRARGGAELDLVLGFGAGRRLAFAVKFSRGAGLTRGFSSARAEVAPEPTYVVAPAGERVRLREGVTMISLGEPLRDELPSHL